MCTRNIIAVLSLGWLVIASRAAEPPKYQAIDPKTIAAYEELGAIPFFPGKEGSTNSLPGFSIYGLQDGRFPKLPPVLVPFALKLGCRVKDADLKELKNLKNLISLDLSIAEITNAGLKEVRDFADLTTLSLAGELTDETLKELKNLRNLTSLSLRVWRVTGVGLKELKDLNNLTTLNLSDMRATDADLKQLKGIENLASLCLRHGG